MRRKEQEITDKKEIEKILHHGDICRVALFDDDYPYIVPVNYGYQDGCLYFHSAPHGKKIELITKNPKVGFELETDLLLVKAATACGWSMRYKSIIGYGTARVLSDRVEVISALDIIMKHYSGQNGFTYDDNSLNRMVAVKICIHHLTAKRSG
jgi:hypothetical protein